LPEADASDRHRDDVRNEHENNIELEKFGGEARAHRAAAGRRNRAAEVRRRGLVRRIL
jgi:hypothetical protein